ncbi:MAG: amino acid adenylation domain-containing protein [Bryobacteraceae bacterium]
MTATKADKKLRILGRSDIEAQTYWQARMDAILPTDLFPRPSHSQNAAPLKSEFLVSKDAAGGLLDLAGGSDMLLYATLLAAAETCAFRYFGHRLLVMGSPGRDLEGGTRTRALLPIVSRIDPEMTIGALLNELRSALLGAYDHQAHDCEEFGGSIQIAVRLDSLHDPLPDLTRALCIDVRDKSDGSLQSVASISANACEPEVFAGFVRHFGRLVESLPRYVHTPLWRVPLLEESERRTVLVDWNVSTAGPRRDVCLHELFEEQAIRTPEAAAVVAGNDQITYADLDRRAEAMATALRNRGVGPDVLVGVELERSIGLLVCVLGIWKAGGAYLPIDAGYPSQRISQTIDDCRPAILLTRENIGDCFPVSNSANSKRQADPRNLAYAIVTSGSTGKPKAVLVEHRGVANIVAAQREMFRAQPGDRVLQIASISFDASIFEMLMALTSGATLCIKPAEDLAHVEEQRFTHVTLTPSVLSALPSEALRDVSVMVVAGEECSAELVSRWSNGRRMFNAYGPTEASIWSTVWLCDAGRPGRPPIGKPLPYTRAYVLDEQLEPLPAGVAGELCLAGVGLARGYMNLPELTAERFVPEPFGEDGGRLYRTGDLARFTSDGDIEILGRRDRQVKVHGHRIEMGEIESTLREHPSVRDAIVQVFGGNAEEKYLAAYIIPRGEALSWDELVKWLAGRLPAYTIPKHWVQIAELPRTLSGKLDRKALPVPTIAEKEATAEEPSTDAEKRLLRIWCEVLHAGHVGLHQNFFALGGDSILSIQVVARAQREGLSVTVKQLYQHPTVAALAVVAQVADAPSNDQGHVSGSVDLTPIQRWFFDREWDDPSHFNQAVMLEAREPVSEDGLHAVVRAVVEHHDALRSCFKRVDGEWRQEILGDIAADPVAIELTENLDEIEERADDWQRRFDLASGLLFRAILFRTGGEADRVMLLAHHLVVDGVSWRVLLEDLEIGFAQWLRGEPVRFQRKTASFQTWAERLRVMASSREVIAELPYWESQCSCDESDEQAFGPTGSVTVALNEEETRALLQDVPARYGTQINDVLLTALVEALGCEGQLSIALEGHGREEFVGLDVSRSVGWFTAQYPLRLEVQPDQDIGEKLLSVKEQLRRVPSGGIGYGLLRWDGGAKLRMSPSVGFNYLGQLDGVLPADGLFTVASQSAGEARSMQAQAPFALNIDAAVWGGQFRVTWVFRCSSWSEREIGARANAFLEALRTITGSKSPVLGARRPTDFPLAKIDQERLARLFTERGDIEDIYPLSPTQQGLLFHHLLEPDSRAYHAQMSCLLELRDRELWKDAIQQVFQRHPVLRTSFLWEGVDDPLQITHRESAVVIEGLDWRSLSEEERDRAFVRFREADLERRFDLTRPSQTRVTLAMVGKGRVWCLWSFHHLLLDGWSGTRLLAEIAETYSALLDKRRPQLEPVASYRDYIAWCLRRPPEQAEQFWREYLRGYNEPVRLIDCSLPEDTPAGSDSKRVKLSRTLSNKLRGYSAEQSITLSTIFRAAWAMVVACYSGKRDVVFGATMADRDPELRDVERIVGLLIGTIPIRVNVGGNVTCEELLRRLHLDAQDQMGTALNQISAWSEIPQGTPLFESILVFENYPAVPPARTGLQVLDLSFENRTNFPLTIEIQPSDEIGIRATFDRRRFDADVAQSLLDTLDRAIQNLIEGDSRRVGALQLLSEAERDNVIREWNETAVTWDGSRVIHKLFAAQCERTPDRVALVDSNARFTYSELDRASNRVAQWLISRGVRRGDLAGLCMERSANLLVAALGILKAGAGYVPMEPSYPRERLAWVVEDAALRVVIGTRASQAVMAGLGVEVLVLDEAETLLEGYSTKCPPVTIDEHDTAYVIYTSGSTGKPKGVVVEHGSVVNYVHAMRATADLEDGMSWAMLQPLSVDSSVTALYPPLFSGGTVHVIGAELGSDGAAFRDYLEREQIDCLKIAPSHLAALGDVMPARRLIIGGEASEAFWAKGLLTKRPGCRVWNHYGPTETTVGVLACEVRTEWNSRRGATAPIGNPLANTRAYVLDAEMEPVPVGVEGELYIGGACLARGYLNRPELTAELFVPDRFEGSGGRLYRTGDLVRFLPDGKIVFLGRADQQVKIRGNRIETEEIEAKLREAPGVREVVIEARERSAGDKRLVAYIVPSNETPPDWNALRAWLKDRLPEYMIPSAWVQLPKLPRSAHGKLDRKALPAPEWNRSEDSSDAPTNEVERKLARIWQEVIGVEKAGRDDNFFDLGGDSIHSIQIISRARAEGIYITVKQVFEQQTIANLAAVAGTAGSTVVDQRRVTGDVPLTPIQRWFFEQDWLEPWHFNLSILLEAREPVNESALRSAVGSLVDHHDALRTRFERDGGHWRQVIVHECPSDPVSVEELNNLGELGQRASEWQKRFDLSSGLLFRAVLFRFADGTSDRVLSIAHHLVVDGVSMRVLLQDLDLAYKQVPLAPKTASFQEWANRLQSRVGKMESESAYWEEQCAEGASLSDGTEQNIRTELSEEETRALLQDVPSVYRTRFDEVLLTALLAALQREELLVEMEGHGRDERLGCDVSRTAGWFTVHYPLLLNVTGQLGIGQRLKSVKEQVRQVPGTGIGYGMLQYLGSNERQAKLGYQASVSFNYLGQLDTTLPSGSFFQIARESPGVTESHTIRRDPPFRLSAYVLDGRLHMVWHCPPDNDVPERFENALRDIIEHCRRPDAGGFTPSDFPEMDFDQNELDELTSELAASSSIDSE